MINLDQRYESYISGTKTLRINCEDEKVKSYGYTDDGTDVTGFYVRTEHYKLYYDNDAKFLKLETIITNPFPNIKEVEVEGEKEYVMVDWALIEDEKREQLKKLKQ